MVYVLRTTQNLVISRRCFAEDGKEMYQELWRTCAAIVSDVHVTVAVVVFLNSLLWLPCPCWWGRFSDDLARDFLSAENLPSDQGEVPDRNTCRGIPLNRWRIKFTELCSMPRTVVDCDVALFRAGSLKLCDRGHDSGLTRNKNRRDIEPYSMPRTIVDCYVTLDCAPSWKSLKEIWPIWTRLCDHGNDSVNRGLLAWICIERLDGAEPVLSVLAGCWDVTIWFENGVEKSVRTP